jgi:hypothetical protein
MRTDHSRWRVTPGKLLDFDPQATRRLVAAREDRTHRQAAADCLTERSAPLKSAFRNVRHHVLIMALLCAAALALSIYMST